jgi:hypothetical protein
VFAVCDCTKCVAPSAPNPPTPPSEDSYDETVPLNPHRGRFKLGEDSSDTDSSDVDSIVMKRDVKRKLQGHSDSEGGSDDEDNSKGSFSDPEPVEPVRERKPEVIVNVKPIVTAAASPKRGSGKPLRAESEDVDLEGKFATPLPARVAAVSNKK